MRVDEEYRLSEFQDLGMLGDKKSIRLKRHKIYGVICVEKRVPEKMFSVYQYLKENQSPYIPRIYECVLDKNEVIVIEEYVEGRSLEDILTEQKIEEREAVRIAIALCNALKIVHHAKPMIVCRDLKAENVMIDKGGNVKLIDFNIARMFREGQHRDTVLLGTAEYAAPEQFGYFQTDNRTDIYALGVLINYMLLRKFPVEQIVQGRMEPIVRKCINLEPKGRYQTVEELERELLMLYPKNGYYEKEMPKKAARKFRDFMIPGFRSKTPWKMLTAVLGYLFITWSFFTMEFTQNDVPVTGITLRFEQTMLWMEHIVFVFIVCNYMGCRNKIPILNSKKRWLRVVGYVITYFVLFVIAAFLFVVGDTIF